MLGPGSEGGASGAIGAFVGSREGSSTSSDVDGRSGAEGATGAAAGAPGTVVGIPSSAPVSIRCRGGGRGLFVKGGGCRGYGFCGRTEKMMEGIGTGSYCKLESTASQSTSDN